MLVVGPDGSGKTAVADTLQRLLEDAGVTVSRAHHRPGVLFRRDRDAGPVTEPHAQRPRGFTLSAIKLLAVFVDYLLGHLGPWRRAARRGVLIVERGWHDMAVDPRRYRLPTSLTPMVARFGRVIPRSDMALVLGGDPAVFHDRKPELPTEEIARQQRQWERRVRASARNVLALDSTRQSPDEIAIAAVEHLDGSRDGDGGSRWIRAPIARARLDLRMRAERASVPALALYRPLRRRALLAQRVNHALLTRGWGRGVRSPLPDLDELAAHLEIEFDGVATFRSSAPGRLVVGLAKNGALTTVLKVGPPDDAGLEREGGMLSRLGDREMPFRVPRLLWYGPWGGHMVVATEGLETERTTNAGIPEIADLCTALCSADDPLVHGDLAPWNLLADGDLVIVDWEEARTEFEPLFDLTHYVIQGGALLGAHRPASAARYLTAPGSPGWRHLESLDHDPALAPKLVHSYLERTNATEPAARRYRHAVREQLR